MSRSTRPGVRSRTIVIACGALAREITEVLRLNGWTQVAVTCLPAILHNTPDRIPEAVRRKIRDVRPRYERILVAYGDCGTGGLLDEVLEQEGVDRIAGPHCYAFYAGLESFLERHEADPRCFYLTDYLVRHFDSLIIKGLGLDRYPQLLPDYFGNYRNLVYLAQSEDPELQAKARAAAERLGLTYQHCFTGMGELGAFLADAARSDASGGRAGSWHS